MKQAVVYDKQLGIVILYRGGYNKETNKGLDRYKRNMVCNTFDGNYMPIISGMTNGISLMAEGAILHPHYNGENIFAFFGIDENTEKRFTVVNVSLNVCFANGFFVFYKDGVKPPKRVSKTWKHRNKTFNRWENYSYNNPISAPFHLDYWKFENETDYLLCSETSNLPFTVCPSLVENDGLYTQFRNFKMTYEDYAEKMYCLEPIHLADSWDYSDEQKQFLKDCEEKLREKREKYLADLEQRKHTAGFCSHCGAEHAEYVANPYYEEMYGETVMQWLCSDCYHDIAMDV